MGASDEHEKGPPGNSAPHGRTRGAVRRPDDGRLQRGRRTRVRLREAARSLILEVGFDRATLRGIAERAGMGASSIYRHVRSKEDLLIWELADLQGEAWTHFRETDDRSAPTRERVSRFFGAQHELLARHPDFTVIALRATTYPQERVARDSLRLTDRTVALLAEILQSGRKNGDVDRAVDLLSAANALCHVATSARISWANGLITEDACRRAIEASVDLLFRGIGN